MYLLVFLSGTFIVFFNVIFPYFYTFTAWNYSLAVISCMLFFANVTLFMILLVFYFFLPSDVIDSFFATGWAIIKNLNHSAITKVESNIRETFPIHILHPIPDRSIRIWHPHGTGATTIGIHNVYRITDPGNTQTKIVVHYLFTIFPVIRDMVRYMGCISSDYGSIVDALKNNSITVGLGGAEEMGKVTEKTLELVIKKRKGIFKIALETGTPIVPVLTYGENEIFPETDNEFLLEMNQLFYEYTRIRLSLPNLVSVRNWANLLVKPLDPIHTYTGRPIYVKKIDKPTNEHIRLLRKIYIKRVRELFDQTNPGDFTLKIV
jgi:hypothetical protein